MATISPILAQTFTDCNPLNASLTCPNDAALGMDYNFYFNTSSTVTNSWNITAGSLVYGASGTEFTVAKKGDSPTIQSQFYIFFGSVSVVMKAATGQGIISSIVLESDDLDEVDWEFMGGNATFAETNYFGKGNTTSFDRAIYYPVSSDVRENFHNYTVVWTSDKLEWLIDGTLVRTLEYADANGGKNYPQTPMTVRMGIWAGGDSEESNGTIEWAGGVTDYSKGPYTMYVQSAQINDFSTGSAYVYSDHSGSFESIKTLAGNSTIKNALIKAETPTLSVAQKFAALPQSTKLAIYGGSGAAAALLLSAFLFVCVRQRRAGRREREAYNAKVEREREETLAYQMELKDKGVGGWDSREVATQGDDALGGWGGSHVSPPVPKVPFNFSSNEIKPAANTYAGYSSQRSPDFYSPEERHGGGAYFSSPKGGYQRF